MKHKHLNNAGLSIIATVFALLALAFFVAVAVSIVTTGASVGVQEERSTQAFYIAEGGLQYTLKRNTYPYYALASTSFGDSNGSFTVSVPTLSSTAAIGDTSLSVSSTEGFVQAAPPSNTDYWVLLCGTASDPIPTVQKSSDCEKISCTSKFSTCTRGKDSTDAAEHISASVVMTYTWDTTKTTTIADRSLAKGAKCSNAASRICVSSTTGFANSGFVRIFNATENNIEDVFYDGIGTTVAQCASSCTTNLCLGTNGCTRRAFDGGGSGTTTHAVGTQIWQSEFSVITTATGAIPNTILTNIKREVQSNVLMLRDP